MKKIRIGGGAGFAGDRVDAAVVLIEKGNLDYIIFECLAERTIGLAKQEMLKDPTKGYSRLLEYRMVAGAETCERAWRKNNYQYGSRESACCSDEGNGDCRRAGNYRT